MTKLSLNKSALNKQNMQLNSYQRFLPSLDMKRRQLVREKIRARQLVEQTEKDILSTRQMVASTLPMASNKEIDLDQLVVIEQVQVSTENVMGTLLPVLKDVKKNVKKYALLGTPHWVDHLALCLEQMLNLQIRLQVEKRRYYLLEDAVKKITQRVNLFDKVLIPRTRNNIKKIKIHLADIEKAAVVRSKIAKRKHARTARQ